MQKSAIGVVVLAQCVAIFGCGSGTEGADPPERSCTEVGCESMLTVEFEGAESLGPGAYTITVETSAGTTECDVALTDPDEFEGIGIEDCVGPDEVRFSANMIGILGTYTAVTVRVEDADSGAVSQVSLTPLYSEERPNGPDCEPVCQVASETMGVTEILSQQ